MRIRHTIAAVAIAAAALTACSSTTDQADTKPKATSSPAPAKAAGLTAKAAAAQLADATGVTDLGNPSDNTSGCASGSEWDCTQLITTDTVSIYEYKSPAVAAHWVKAMKKTGDWRQVGRFALAWTARDQDLTSDDRRAELVTALKKATASEA
ncbi:hypothetical protein ACGFZS_09795 [Streptomyces sp. NPDC048288]|uniref:hypothetical protein n=1 Tax=Streptomyces sp. NPDC048288 TaxID=3365529 RepID=UPI003712597D